MSSVSERGRHEPPLAGNEVDTLLGSLDRQRATLAWKCGGLNTEAMRATTAASKITLGSLLKHLALIEDDYFSHRLLGKSPVRHGIRSTGGPTLSGNGGPRPTTRPRS